MAFKQAISVLNNAIAKRAALESTLKFDIPDGMKLFKGTMKPMALAGGRYSIRYNVSYVGKSLTGRNVAQYLFHQSVHVIACVIPRIRVSLVWQERA